ncbi:MAG TPA: signal peptide peptidase SppA [Candidatus Acidoferrales bacterium]|nr:signal peptide peptidase SppA [Candidatus Acidoferrales bacterium]
MIRRLFRWFIRTAIIAVVLFAIMAVSDYLSHRVEPGSALSITLNGPMVERGDGKLMGLLNSNQTPLNYVRIAIDRAAKDPRIVGLQIKIVDPEMELAQAQEIVALIKSFKSHNKWVTAYLETAGESGPGNLPYLVASAADEVSLMPQGELNLVGVGVRELFARGTLDWLGITPNFESMGQYKSAANMFTNKDFTAAQKEEDEGLVGSLYDQIVAATAADRKLSPDAIKTLIDQAPLDAQAGLKAHLVDRLEYEDQFAERMKERGGAKHKSVEFTNYARGGLFSNFGATSDQIAVIYGDGTIERGDGGINPFSSPGSDAMNSDDIGKAFKSAREDDSVRAVIFRVNSPGGSVIASELIRREVELTAKKKPVVVSMSSYAASGGYWVSTPAARIIAEPGTITGSIGVLGGKFNVSPAAAKIFANTGAVTRGANVEMFDMWTDFTPAQARQFHDQMLGDTYQYFLKLVAASRRITVEQADAVAQGRVWTGEQALKNQLVDSLGGFDDAMTAAKSLARLAPDQAVGLVELPEQPGLLQQLLGRRIAASLSSRPSSRIAAPVIELIRAALSGQTTFSAAYCPVVPLL